MEYQKINGKVVEVGSEIKVQDKLNALNDRLKQLAEEKAQVEKEIADLTALK